MDTSQIRNFCIIAHIDHGKSTLSSQFLRLTNTIAEKDLHEQELDAMDLERERGITIKSQAVRMNHTEDGQEFQLNLIDTPGHVDFSYEVDRSLAACEGAILLVDAVQGMQAQSIHNLHQARENGLTVIPAINKIDRDDARVDRTKLQLAEHGFAESEIVEVSAKEGVNIESLLQEVIYTIPPPSVKDEPTRALVFDSHYDDYRGAILYLRLLSGSLEKGDPIRALQAERDYKVSGVGVFEPDLSERSILRGGEVGYCHASIKDISDVFVGDTITRTDEAEVKALPGYREQQPMMFCGLFPISGEDYEDLREALQKLALNDPVLEFEPVSKEGLGFGFTCGFLGLLHMEITQERLEREYDMDLIVTAPNVEYEVVTTDDETIRVVSPSDLPDPNKRKLIREPRVKLTCLAPDEHVGDVMDLCEAARGEFEDMAYLDEETVELTYDAPMAELAFGFYDDLKSATHGYGSMEYEYREHREADLQLLEMRLNEESVDALSFIVHRDGAYRIGRRLAEKLKEEIPRQQFSVPIQAVADNEVIAREDKPALRKDVTDKCYGGDVTRKRKLLEEQKEGKKRMKEMGDVSVPQDALLSILEID